MPLDSVKISKGVVGPNLLNNDDAVCGLIMHGVAVTGKIDLLEAKQIFKLKDAEELGLDAAYDVANDVQVYYHIKEFYRMVKKVANRDSNPLFIMLVSNAVTTGNLDVTMTNMVEDTGTTMAKKLIQDADGRIRYLGVAMNPAAGYTSTILDGLDADVQAAIPKAQGLADWAWENDRPLNVILEGREFSGTAAAAQDLRAITDVKAENVSVTIAQDYKYADGLNDQRKKHAAIGTVLGTRAALAVHENIGEVERCNITDVIKDAFIIVGFSSHEKVADRLEDLSTLDSKGYIFAFRFTDFDGVYFNNDHTCTPVEEDAEGNKNLHQIAYGAIVGKAKRVLRTALLPKIKSTHNIDPTTGKLSNGTIKYFEGLGDTPLQQMVSDGEIVAGETYVDPDSNLLNTPRILNVDFAIVPKGTIDKIQGSITLKSSL